MTQAAKPPKPSERHVHTSSKAPKTANSGPKRLRAADATREQFAGKGRIGNDFQDDRQLGSRRGTKT